VQTCFKTELSRRRVIENGGHLQLAGRAAQTKALSLSQDASSAGLDRE